MQSPFGLESHDMICMRLYELFKPRSLSEQDEDELIAQHGLEVRELLPVLGPLFGLAVIIFSAWDYLIDPAQVWITLPVRIAFVLAGSIAYFPTRLRWTAVQRSGYIYWTHTCAFIVSEFLTTNGLLLGLAGITSCVFTVSVIALRIRTFLLILSVPSILFVVLSAISTPSLGFIMSLMLYFFSVILAGTIMLVIRSFRQKAYLLEKELLNISRHDSLTGAYSRGYLMELAEREVALAKRRERSLALAILDIDHFKNINDTYGHNIGDEVIKKLVNTCKENLRVIDHFGRIGGEEFVCVLPEADAREAMICAERLRRSIEAIRMDIPQGQLQFTVSIGVALLDASHNGWRPLLKDADTALYCAKREGRNRVVMAPSHTP